MKKQTNCAGQTYGSGLRSINEELPDLISVVGDSGASGYVTREDRNGHIPTTGLETAEWVKAKGFDEKRIIPVYAEDGKTIVDQKTYGIQKIPAKD